MPKNRKPRRTPRLSPETRQRLSRGHRWPNKKREANRTAARRPVSREDH